MTPEVAVYRRFNLPLIYWERKGQDPKGWKGPHSKNWNDRDRVYDLTHFDPEIHNLGTPTGREIAPARYTTDIDIDQCIEPFVVAFLLRTSFALSRPGKAISHLLYTTPTPYKGRKEYKALNGGKPYSRSARARLSDHARPVAAHASGYPRGVGRVHRTGARRAIWT